MSDAIAAIKDWVIRGMKNEAVAATREALEAGVDPGAIMKDGLIAAMSVVGEKYSSGEFFLPQMMIAARAMTEVIPVLKPHLVGEAADVADGHGPLVERNLYPERFEVEEVFAGDRYLLPVLSESPVVYEGRGVEDDPIAEPAGDTGEYPRREEEPVTCRRHHEGGMARERQYDLFSGEFCREHRQDEDLAAEEEEPGAGAVNLPDAAGHPHLRCYVLQDS